MEDLSTLQTILFIVTIVIGTILGALSVYISHKIYNIYEFEKKELMYGAILNGIAFSLISAKYMFSGNLSYLIILFMLITVLTAHFIIDYKYQDLPDLYNLIIFVLSIISVVMWDRNTLIPYMITAGIMFGSFLLIAIITGSLGGGDIKLMGAVGMFFHYSQIPKILIYSFFTASIFAIALLLLKKKNKDDKFAFGPFLIIAIIITLIT